MPTSTLTLTDFLLARIAEDEQDAVGTQVDIGRWKRENDNNGVDGSQGSITVASLIGTACDPDRVLARLKVDRQIVEIHGTYHECADGRLHGPADDDEESNQPCDTLRALATPYADHPEFHREWL